MPDIDTPAGPFAHAAALYRAASWQGVLPLPPRSKKPVPTGFTGHAGLDPSWPDLQAWIDGSEAAGNIALRLPAHVIGIDIDNYDEKPGARSYAEMLIRWGHLPRTWRSTSRDDGISGIYLFSVPDGLAWPGAPAAGIEIIQFAHRYAVVWPSIHPEGGTYRWHSPNGAVVLAAVPNVDELPPLPDAWVQGLTGGRERVDLARAGLASGAAYAWLLEHGDGLGICPAMERALARYVNEFVDSGLSRHDVAMRASARIVKMIQEGHSGGLPAVESLWAKFEAAVARTPNREHDPGEWSRLLDGAVNLAAVNPVVELDPCVNPDPFATLLNRGTSSPTPTPSTTGPTGSADSATTTSSGTSPNVPSPDAGASTSDPAAAQRALLLLQEIERQRANRGARRHLDEEDAALLFREPLWVRTLTEELNLPDNPIPFAVSEVLPAGGNVLLTAQFKAGKTTLVNNLARSLVDGSTFLDRFDVTGEHRVGIFNYEVDRDQYRRWLRDEAIENTDRVSVLNLRGYRMPLIASRIEDWVVKWLTDHGITCWILDPFARAFVGSGVSENDNTEVGRFLDTLDIIKARAGVRELIVPTHTGRVAQEAGSERARGATRLDDWADVRWLLSTDDEGDRYFRAIGRDVEFDEVKLGFMPLSRRLYIEGAGRKKQASSDLGASIMAAVRATPGIKTRELKEAIGGRAKTVNDKILSLVSGGRLRREGSEHAGYQHFAIDLPTLTMGGSQSGSQGGSGGSEAVPPGGSPAPFRGRNHGSSQPTDEEEEIALAAMSRETRISQGEALREAIARGQRVRLEPNGNLLDITTGEVIWSPVENGFEIPPPGNSDPEVPDTSDDES